MTKEVQRDIIYMYTMRGLEAGRIRCELYELGKAICVNNWNVVVPMMDAIEDWTEDLTENLNVKKKKVGSPNS